MNLGNLHPAVQTSYLIMMYISVFPIAISVRRTNVYEEKSLGIYSKNEIDEQANGTDMEYVGAHLRRQLSFDLWYIFVGFFILTISEGPRLQTGDFSMFAVLFEIVSAYGTVGLSLGYATVNASLFPVYRGRQTSHHRHDDPRPAPRPAVRPRSRHPSAQRLAQRQRVGRRRRPGRPARLRHERCHTPQTGGPAPTGAAGGAGASIVVLSASSSTRGRPCRLSTLSQRHPRDLAQTLS